MREPWSVTCRGSRIGASAELRISSAAPASNRGGVLHCERIRPSRPPSDVASDAAHERFSHRRQAASPARTSVRTAPVHSARTRPHFR